MVITGRTRNALALRGTRVRIPPTPLEESGLRFRFLFVSALIITYRLGVCEEYKRNKGRTAKILKRLGRFSLYRYCKYSRNFFTASDALFLLFSASPILRYAGTSSSFAKILYGTRFKMSCGKILMPRPLSTIDIMA